MVHVQPIQEHEASTEVKEVFDEIKQKRKVDEVNNFWKYLAKVITYSKILRLT